VFKKIFIIILIASNTVIAANFDQVYLNGYFSFEYENQLTNEGNGDPNGSLDLDLIDLVFNFRPTAKTRISADFTWEHGTATEHDKGNAAVEYAFAEHSFSRKFKLRVGKFLIPFGIFNQIHTSKPAYLSVKEAASTNKTERIVTNAYRFFPRWGTGVGFVGDIDINKKLHMEYDFLITNGDGNGKNNENEFEEDYNKSKALTARVKFYYMNNHEIGFSLYNDRSQASNVDYDLSSVGVHLISHIKNYKLMFEYVHGNKDPTNATAVDQVGYMVQLSYDYERLGLIPYARYESIDPNKDTDDDEGMLVIIGLNYQLDEAAIIKFELNSFMGKENAQGLSTLPSQSYKEIKAAFIVGF